MQESSRGRGKCRVVIACSFTRVGAVKEEAIEGESPSRRMEAGLIGDGSYIP